MKPIALSAITAFAPKPRGSRRGRAAQRQSARLISARPVVQLPARLLRWPDRFDGLGGPYFVGYVFALGFIIWLILASR